MSDGDGDGYAAPADWDDGDPMPGETLEMRVVIGDAFDGLEDSAVLLDAIQWERTSGTGVSRPTIQ